MSYDLLKKRSKKLEIGNNIHLSAGTPAQEQDMYNNVCPYMVHTAQCNTVLFVIPSEIFSLKRI